MCGIDQVLNELFPTDWCDPYGNMPLNKQYSVQIDITQVETDDGIKVTAVKTPPQAGTTSIQDAINMALGMSCCSEPCKKPEGKEKKSEDHPENRQEDQKQGQKNDEGGEDSDSDDKKDKEKPDFQV